MPSACGVCGVGLARRRRPTAAIVGPREGAWRVPGTARPALAIARLGIPKTTPPGTISTGFPLTRMDKATSIMDSDLGLTAAPTMGNLAKVGYSHRDMIDYIIASPGCGLRELSLRYGYSIGWISNIQASDAWKSAMAARRAEMVDPVLHATITERFEGITALSLQRLQEKLEAPQVSDNVVLRAVELGARAMGIGGNAAATVVVPQGDHLAMLANRLIELQSRIKTGVNYAQPIEVEDAHLVA